jgi:phosphopantetheinyl transferase (holo-ACP synthase)
LNDIVLQPATTFISESVSAEMLGDPSTDYASAMITDVPYSVFDRNEELWLKILSAVVLSVPERKEIEEMKWSVSRRTEWLFGRIAAKEAVRRYLKEYHQARWSYADVQIWPDESGKPQAIGAWGDHLTSRLDVAIAHTSQFVIAIAASNARAGVDAESASRNLSEEFSTGVFIPEEIALATAFPNTSQALLRFWCAKEAVSKALGTGIRFSPKEMVVTGYLPDSGSTIIRLTGAWLDMFKNFRGRDIPVTSRTMRGHALAFCFIPASLFKED